MEFTDWFLGYESQAEELATTDTHDWPQVELTRFMSDYLFVPLFSIMIQNSRPIDDKEILDKELYSDLSYTEANIIAGTTEGYYVFRVNPELVRGRPNSRRSDQLSCGRMVLCSSDEGPTSLSGRIRTRGRKSSAY